MQSKRNGTIVFIPGWSTSRLSYRLAIKYWEDQDFQVIVPEAKFRRSSSLQASLDQYVEDVYTFLSERGAEHFILAGHSLGGLVAMNYASKYASQVKRLVLIDSAGVVPEHSLPVWGLWIARMWTLIMFKDSARVGWDILFDHLKHIFTRPAHLWISGRIAQNIGIEQVELPDQLEKVVWWAEDDGVIPLEFGEKLSNGISPQEFSVVAGRHMWLCTRPHQMKEFV